MRWLLSLRPVVLRPQTPKTLSNYFQSKSVPRLEYYRKTPDPDIDPDIEPDTDLKPSSR